MKISKRFFITVIFSSIFTLVLFNPILAQPGTPTGLVATGISPNQINLTWNDVSNEAAYEIYWSDTENGTYNNLTSVSANTTSYTVGNLASKLTKFFKVRAMDRFGVTSDFSNIDSAKTFSLSTPTGLIATAVSPNQINLTWNDINYEAAYEIYWSDTENGTYNNLTSVSPNTTTYAVGNLASKLTKFFKVRAMDRYGVTSDFSNIDSAKTFPLSTPGGFSATGVSINQINLTWNDINYEYGYSIYWSNTENGSYSLLTSVSANTISYFVTGLGANLIKYFKIQAYDRFGVTSDFSQTDSAKTFPTPVPTGLSAATISSSEIHLTWNDLNGETGYNLYRSTSPSGPFSNIVTLGANITSYNNTGLTTGTTYYYTISSYNSAGESQQSSPVNATTQMSGPETPTGLTATAISMTEIRLSWNDVEDETQYNIYVSNSENGIYTYTTYATPNVTTRIISGLNAGTTKYFKITACGPGIESAQSLPVSATTLSPAVPTGLTATAISMTEIRLTWNDQEGETQYNIYMSGSENGTYTYIAYATPNVTTRIISGLPPNTIKYFKITACGPGLESAQSSPVSATTLSPTVPTGFTATAISTSEIRLTWNDQEGETQYNIYMSDSENGTYTYTTYATPNVTTRIISGLPANTTKYFKITACGPGIESAQSLPVSATTLTPAPPMPTGLVATAISASQIQLTWNDLSDETGYYLYRSTSPTGTFSLISTLGENVVSYSNTGLNAGTTYYYKVSAYGTGGESLPSSSVNATTLTLGPDLSVTDIQFPTDVTTDHQFSITYTLKNNGDGQVNGTWFDRVYISTSPTYNPALMTQVATQWSTAIIDSEAVYQMTFNVNLTQLPPGNYYVYVTTDGNNYISESNENNNTLRSTSAFRLHVPDLIVTDIQFPTDVTTDHQFSITYTLKNNGDGQVNGTWFDRVYISTSPTYNPALMTQVATQWSTAIIDSGAVYPITIDVDLTQSPPGSYYVYVTTDGNNYISESNENNNTLRSTSPFGTGLPDLEVVNLVAPPEIIPGQIIQFTYTVKNNGSANAHSWVDAFYISRSSIFNPDSCIFIGAVNNMKSLASGESYTNTTSNYVRQLITGNYYVYVLTDENKTITESDENNNVLRSTGAIPIHIPDLIVTELNVPTDITTQIDFPLSFKVKNIGDGRAGHYRDNWASWSDGIYFSKSPVFNRDSLIGFTDPGNVQELLPDSSYTWSWDRNYLLLKLQGEYYVYIVADDHKNLFETNTGNNFIRSTNPVRMHVADLVVENVNIPTNIGVDQDFPITFTVKNIGDGRIGQYIGNWSDAIYISHNPVYDPASLVYLQEDINKSILDPGASYTNTLTCRIPSSFSLQEPYYFYIITDFKKWIGELDENNNIWNSSSLPDLVVDSISIPSDITVSQPFQITYMRKNIGKGPTGNSWSDGIYLSKSQTFIPDSSTRISDIQYQKILNSGESDTISTTCYINVLLKGKYYVFIKTDMTSQIGEANENNNILRSDSAATMHAPDLIVTNVTIPKDSVLSPNFQVTYSIKNIGDGVAGIGPGRWISDVYISKSPVFNTDSVISVSNLNSIDIPNAINPGESYNVIASCLSNQVFYAPYYIYIKTNASNTLLELNLNNNLWSSVGNPKSGWNPSTAINEETIYRENSVGIGFTTDLQYGKYGLLVNGSIITKQADLTITGWPDYVFGKNYKLMSISELENYIKVNNHLPGIPSEQEVKENGIGLGEIQSKLLKKVEELTIDIIKLKKKNEVLHAQIEALKVNKQKKAEKK